MLKNDPKFILNLYIYLPFIIKIYNTHYLQIMLQIMFQTRFQLCQYPKPNIYKNQFYRYFSSKNDPFLALFTNQKHYKNNKFLAKKLKKN